METPVQSKHSYKTKVWCFRLALLALASFEQGRPVPYMIEWSSGVNDSACKMIKSKIIHGSQVST